MLSPLDGGRHDPTGVADPASVARSSHVAYSPLRNARAGGTMRGDTGQDPAGSTRSKPSRFVVLGLAVLTIGAVLTGCGGGGSSSDPTVLRAGQLDIKLPEGYKVVDGKVVERPAGQSSGSSGQSSDSATATTAIGTSGATATTGTTGTTIPLKTSSNPQGDMMTAFGKFRACLDRDGVKFVGAPNSADPSSPANDPDYVKSLSRCAAESNILAALKAAQTAQENLTPAEIKQQNKNYLKWRKCMIGKGWKIPEPKPNANGSLVSFGTSSADPGTSSGSSNSTGGMTPPPGKDIMTSSDLSDCAAKIQSQASK